MNKDKTPCEFSGCGDNRPHRMCEEKYCSIECAAYDGMVRGYKWPSEFADGCAFVWSDEHIDLSSFR